MHTSAVQVKNQGVRLHTEHQSASEVGCTCEEDGSGGENMDVLSCVRLSEGGETRVTKSVSFSPI